MIRLVLQIMVVCLLCSKLNAQADDNYKWNLKLGILNFIDPGNPAIQIGVERFINDRNSVQVEGGYILPYNFDLSEYGIKPKYKGYIFKGGYKYWFVNNRIYSGLEIFTRRNNYVANLKFKSSYTDSQVEPYYYDVVNIRREFTGVNIVGGYVKSWNPLFLDFMIGAGLGSRKVNHTNRINPDDIFLGDTNVTFSNLLSEEMNESTWNITLDIKLGYRF
jgi:hypothetical protein